MRLGGLGLTSAAGQADAAWCGSWAQCWSLADAALLVPALAAIDLAIKELKSIEWVLLDALLAVIIAHPHYGF